jgi:hypothetical protein
MHGVDGVAAESAGEPILVVADQLMNPLIVISSDA